MSGPRYRRKGPAQRKPALVEDEEIDEDTAFTAEDYRIYGDIGSIGGGSDGVAFEEEEEEEGLEAPDNELFQMLTGGGGDAEDRLEDLMLPGEDSDEDDEMEDEDTDGVEDAHRRMLDLLASRRTKTSSSSDGATRRDPSTHISQRMEEQEFGIGSRTKLRLQDLIGGPGIRPQPPSEAAPDEAGDTPDGAADEAETAADPTAAAGLLPADRKARRALRRLLRQDSEAAFEARQVPLEDVVKERLTRHQAYQDTRKNLTQRWQDRVTQTRRAEYLSFEPKRLPHESTASLQAKFRPSNDFEQDLQDLLGMYGLGQEQQKAERTRRREDGTSELMDLEAESLSETSGLTLEQIQARQAELARLRSVMFHNELKFKRIKKIRSKKYRRIARKQKEKHLERMLSDPSVDPEILRAHQEKLELARIKERMTLAHKNKSKWVQRQLRRGDKLTDQERQAIHEQLELGKQLRQKMNHMGGDGFDGGDSDGLEEEEDDEGSDSELEQEAVERLKQEIQDGPAELKQRKGLFALKFMQRAMEKEAADTLQALEAEEEEAEEAEAEEAAASETGRRRSRSRRGGRLQKDDYDRLEEESEERAHQQEQLRQGRRMIGASASGTMEAEEDGEGGEAVMEDEGEQLDSDKTRIAGTSLLSVRKARGGGQVIRTAGVVTVGNGLRRRVDEEDEDLTSDDDNDHDDDDDDGDGGRGTDDEEEEKMEKQQPAQDRKTKEKKKRRRRKKSKSTSVPGKGEKEAGEQAGMIPLTAEDEADVETGMFYDPNTPVTEGRRNLIAVPENTTTTTTTSKKRKQPEASKGGDGGGAGEGLREELDLSRLQQEARAPGKRKRRRKTSSRGSLARDAGKTSGMEDEDDEEEEAAMEDDLQKRLVQRAFADLGDELELEFAAERRRIQEQDLPEELREDNILNRSSGGGGGGMPGWGSWAGEGIQPRKQSAAERRREEARRTAQLRKRKQLLRHREDFKHRHVIKNEKSDRKTLKYLTPVLPHPYSTPEQLEQTLRIPIGRDWNTHSAFQKHIKPKIITSEGHIIAPIQYKKTNAAKRKQQKRKRV